MEFRKLLNMREPVDTRDGRLTVLAMLMMLYVVAMFLSVAIHEVLGHGLFTVLLGGDFYAVYVSPGSGFASLWLPQTMTRSDMGMVYMAGIAVQLTIGVPVLFLVMPRVKAFLPGLFTLVFCVSMLVHASMYLFTGYYYDGGDTLCAVILLGVRPDLFLVTGMVLAGSFVLLISMAALRFMGRFMNLDSDRAKTRALGLFWSPVLLLNGIISLFFALTLSGPEMAYTLLNSAFLLLFIGMALLLVPMFSEPERDKEHRISLKGVLAVVLCFLLLMAGWGGVFGFSRETAHGLLLHEPPVQAERFYSDYAVGNAFFMVHSNGTVRAEITLRNRMASPSPLESKIYRTFDERPDWDYYIARNRNMLGAMLGLGGGAADNLTFSAGYGDVSNSYDGQNFTTDGLGRRCVTYFQLTGAGTRQYYLSPGEQDPQPAMGDFSLGFADPWARQGGYLDMVTVSWEEGLDAVEILAWNDRMPDIKSDFPGERTVVWANTDPEGSPSAYRLTFRFV